MNPKLPFLVIFIVLNACATKPQSIPPPVNVDAMSILPGVWDWDGDNACQKNTHTITFSETGDKLILTHQEKLTPNSESGRTVFAYDIIIARGNSITGIMEDEHRLTESGNPVAWTLTMFTPNSYRWRQTQWAPNSYTNAVVRCAGEAPSKPINR